MQFLYLFMKLVKNSKFKKNITVFGNTNYKKKFKIKYVNIESKKRLFSSQTKNYVKKFIELQKKYKFSIIEVHNRPSYINILSEKLISFFHYIFIMIHFQWMAQKQLLIEKNF